MDGILFAADDTFIPIEPTKDAAEKWVEAYDNGRHRGNWRPSIFMPRWASRITLEVTGVRVERLNDISEKDAKAEGVTLEPMKAVVNGEPGTAYPFSHRQAFIYLWDAINGKRAPWRTNPFVWVVSFRRIDAANLTSPAARGAG